MRTPYVHGTKEWHALRARHVGASEIAALFGVQADYQLTEFQLYHVKSGVPEPKVEGERAAWGLRLEAIIADAAAEQEGWRIQKGDYAEDDECRGIGASLDFEILKPNEEELALGFTGTGVLETKAVDWLIHRKTWTNQEPPLHIALQLQAQLAATGYMWGAVAGLVGGNHLEVYRFRRREELIDEMRTRVNAFWERVAKRNPPPVDGSDGTTEILKTLYPYVMHEPLDMRKDNRFPEICARFLDAQERKKRASKDYDLAKNELADLLRGHKSGYGGGYSVTVSVTPETPARKAYPGEVINGRAESRRYTVKAA